MWRLVEITCASQFCFSDGNLPNATRGDNNESYRLIVNDQGFLDLTEVTILNAIDANGSVLTYPASSSTLADLSLYIKDDGAFQLTVG